MADRGDTHPILGVKDQLHLLTAELTGDGADDMVNAEAENRGAGEVVSATRSGAGTFDLVFRHRYPQLKAILSTEFIGTTAGLRARFTAIDVQAKTATIKCEVAGVATDPAATDSLTLAILVRNSGFNT